MKRFITALTLFAIIGLMGCAGKPTTSDRSNGLGERLINKN